MRLSEVFHRSDLGTGWYVIREDDNCLLPDMPTAVLSAVIAAGACAVGHSGLYEPVTRATALPGGCMYQMLVEYGFGGLPERSWLFGARAVRHVLRLLDLEQPRRRLSGEVDIPTIDELSREWEGFAQQDRLAKIGASLGALAWMDYDNLPGSRKSEPHGHFEPITMPIPPGIGGSSFDPRFRDDWFWRNELTTVRDSTGKYMLTPDGNLTPVN